MTAAGKYRERVTIQVQSTDQPGDRDELGQLVGNWVKFLGPIPAVVMHQRSGEGHSAKQVVATEEYTVTIRRANTDGLSADMRLLWHTSGGGKIVNIVGINFDPKRREVTFSVKA